MMKLVGWITLLCWAGLATAQLEDKCICAPTDEHPEIPVDPKSACPKGDALAAQIEIENYGDYLVATSLNLRLSYLPTVDQQYQHLPLYIVADTVRIDAPISRDNQKIIVNARKIHVSKHGLIDDLGKWTFYAEDIEIHPKSAIKNLITSSKSKQDSNQEMLGLHQLLDFVEFKAVTTNTFDTRTGECMGLDKQQSNYDLDSLSPTFAWLNQQGELAQDSNLVWRSRLIQQYRGDIFEGKLLHKEIISEPYLKSVRTRLIADLEVKMSDIDSLLHSQRNSLVQRNLENLNILFQATEQLISGNFSEKIMETPLIQELELFRAASQVHLFLQDIHGSQSIKKKIQRNLKSFFPKENDFQFLRVFIQSNLGKNYALNHDLNLLAVKWMRIIDKAEELYQVLNIQFEYELELLLDNLRAEKSQSKVYQNRLVEWKSSNQLKLPGTASNTQSLIKLPTVPAQLFRNGRFDQRIWISDQRFNDFAHVRVHDIVVNIAGIHDKIVREHLKIVPLTSIMYDIDENDKELRYTSLPTSYPLADNEKPVTPFTLWRFLPDQHLTDILVQFESLEMIIEFQMTGIHVPGLTGEIKSDDCQMFKDNPFEFTDCKFGGESPFHNVYDIVSVMHLKEINHLFAEKYKAQQAGEQAGVATYIETDFVTTGDGECVDMTDIGGINANITDQVKLVTTLNTPLMYFPPELEGFMELQYELVDSVLTKKQQIENCDTGAVIDKDPKYEPVTGMIKITVPLSMISGDVTDEGKVILDLSEAAIEADLSYTNIYGKPKLMAEFKYHFMNAFTSAELATIQYRTDYNNLSKFTAPKRFLFQTVCRGCQKGKDDEGYLITLFETHSDNGVQISFPKDPESQELSHVLPSDVYTAGVYLGAHITFCDIYLESFQNSLIKERYRVTLTNSFNDAKPHQRELAILYDKDFCIDFGEDLLVDDDGQLSIPQQSFYFYSPTRGARSWMDNTDSEPKAGSKIAKLFRGFQDAFDQCNVCTSWWHWLVSLGIGCAIADAFNCLFMYVSGDLHTSAWVDATLAIYGEQLSNVTPDPECLSFVFPPMDLTPTVDIKLGPNGGVDDRSTRDKAIRRITKGSQEVLRLKHIASPSISLFAVVNLLFPGMKVIDAKEFYSPGTILMYGNIVKDYEPMPNLPDHCLNTDQKYVGF